MKEEASSLSLMKTKKNHTENVFQEISSPSEVIHTEPLLNAFLKEKFNYVNYEV